MHPVAELIYYCGTMDSGKSTLALQTAHNHKSRGRSGLIFTSKDRAGSGVISSRLGLQSAAIEVDPDLDLHKLVVERLSLGDRIDYIICDEAQFYQAEQIEQLAKIVEVAVKYVLLEMPVRLHDAYGGVGTRLRKQLLHPVQHLRQLLVHLR